MAYHVHHHNKHRKHTIRTNICTVNVRLGSLSSWQPAHSVLVLCPEILPMQDALTSSSPFSSSVVTAPEQTWAE